MRDLKGKKGVFSLIQRVLLSTRTSYTAGIARALATDLLPRCFSFTS